jgi:CheY-like chemotaxis protein
MKVLVVEDDELVREVAVEGLTEAGFEVVEAASAEEALARCEEHVADVLFTDIRLPGSLDGWDVAEQCRETNPGLPVIYATGSRTCARAPCRAACGSRSPTVPSRSSTPSAT